VIYSAKVVQRSKRERDNRTDDDRERGEPSVKKERTREEERLPTRALLRTHFPRAEEECKRTHFSTRIIRSYCASSKARVIHHSSIHVLYLKISHHVIRLLQSNGNQRQCARLLEPTDVETLAR
jgi:hypothetical protein